MRDITRGSHGGVMLPEGTTHLTPGAEAEGSVAFGERADHHAFYTAPEIGSDDPDAEKAGWVYAEGKAMQHQMRRSSGGIRPRPVVHMVRPEGPTEVDPNAAGNHGQRRTTGRLRITDTLTTPPPEDDDVAVQGTIPGVNWNESQFGPDMNITDPDRNFLRIKRNTPEPPQAPVYEDDIG